MPEDMMQTLVTGVAVLIFGVIILNQFAALGGTGTVQGEARLATNIEIDPAVKELTSVQETLGTAVAFDGSASAGLSGDIPQPPPGEAELCTFTTLTTTDRNVTIANADGQLAIEFHGNRSTDQWVATRYDRGTRETAAVATAATDPTNRTHVCVRDTGGTLVLNVNGTDAASTAVDGSGAALGATTTSSLNGTVEETRLYETSLTTTQRTTIRTSPTAPASGVTPSARLYYDTRASVGSTFDSTPIYFAATSADLRGATVADGVTGRTVDESDIVLERGGQEARAASGSELDGNPVAFITYDGAGLVGGTGQAVIETIGTAIRLGPIALIAMLAAGMLLMLRNGGKP